MLSVDVKFDTNKADIKRLQSFKRQMLRWVCGLILENYMFGRRADIEMNAFMKGENVINFITAQTINGQSTHKG